MIRLGGVTLEPTAINTIVAFKKNRLPAKFYPARALRALGLLLADGALTVGWGNTFWGIGRVPLRKRA